MLELNGSIPGFGPRGLDIPKKGAAVLTEASCSSSSVGTPPCSIQLMMPKMGSSSLSLHGIDSQNIIFFMLNKI